MSHFTKQALLDIATHLHEKKQLSDEKKEQIFAWAKKNQFNFVAQTLGLKAVHISERDSQITSKPKQMNEFVNTWSIPGFIEEAQGMLCIVAR